MTNRNSGLRVAMLIVALMLAGLDASPGRAVYMVYSDRLIEGSPKKNSISSVPVMPWAGGDAE
jgi:catabolite regulation protein CreA